ncbi:hypothetical protein Agabi119p4_3389 [Agaricus bisporus var. burnettii]|uniref:Methyltransferase domain-containing protein n=1 Tax=Agaricus bisporus var. burnettii TaxID=192524 RepID=A0A8H7F740_AGABI|nr:hypothetical protein Agabi119p4_3389 [Agaricus bisporus var. burnettii]
MLLDQLLKARPSAIILDIACCFGNDIRKAVADGWPVENALASDISKEFWDQGHELFKSTPETFSVGFVDGDALSSSLIEPREPFYSPPLSPRPTDLRTLVSLTPLQGHISVIHASSFFHLFDEEKQLALAKQLASLTNRRYMLVIVKCFVTRPKPGRIYGMEPSSGEELSKLKLD